MAGRRRDPAETQRQHHAAQVAKAGTRKQQFLAMAQWIAAVAWDRGAEDMESAVGLVWGRIQELDPLAEAALKEAQQR